MTRKLTFERIARTEDTDDPVIRAELTDTGSTGTFIVPSEHDRIHVYLVDSRHEGDMSVILDEVVSQLNTSELWFLWPLDEAKPDTATKLKDKLYGFEKQVKEIEKPNGEKVKMDAYIGEWNA